MAGLFPGRATLPLAACLAVVLAIPAVGQTQSPTVIPPAPTIVAAPPGNAPAPAMPDTARPDAAQTAPLTAVPPGLVQTPVPQEPLTPGAAANADTDAAPPPAPAASWDPAADAQLGVLNVVDGSVSEVQIPVGGQANIGDLKVSVLACLRRPPGQVPDAAAFINVQADDAGAPPPVAAANAPLGAPPESTDEQGDAAASDGGGQSTAAENGPPAYRGWMVRSMPAAMVVGDASETFRVIDCS